MDAGHTSCEPGVLLYTVHVDPEDVGRALGKEGRNAGAIRIIAKAVAKKGSGEGSGDIDVVISTESRLNTNSL